MRKSTLSSKRKSEWISSSFGGQADVSNQKKTHVNTQATTKTSSLTPTSNKKDSEEFTPWIEVYKPVTENDLAVHKKKVEEVKQWLHKHFKNIRRQEEIGILLLTGQAGTGKTAVVQVLAKYLNYEIKEWINPVGQDYQEKSNTGWRDFLTSQNSQCQQFSDFLLRANRYNGLSMVGEVGDIQLKKKIVLIEDLPNFVFRNPSKLHTILRQYHVTGRSPVVFIMSDTHTSEATVHSVFPKNIQHELGIHNISFNGVAATALKKAMDKIVSEESKSHEITIPSKDIYEMIAASSNGDIRSCINSLQFFCTDCRLNDATVSKKNGKTKAKTKGTVLKKADRLKQLPEYMQHLTRDQLQVDPEDVFEHTQIASDTFLLYLHQNYPEFFADIDALSDASISITDADVMSGVWANRNIMADYSASVSMRGIMFANTSSPSSTGAVSGGWRPLHKPQWFDSFKTRNIRKRTTNDLFHDSRHTAVDLYTEVLPYLGKTKTILKTSGHRCFVQDISKFPISRNLFRPALKKIEDGAVDDSLPDSETYGTEEIKPTHENEDILLGEESDENLIEDFED
ncbi:cell cycle checkpoint protein RAD17-like isoform X2 [Hydractinia symbiolongicarpus]|uniref:cell cycle checkpoint protein RAD17-like isoform X2 n=1 Tax=Hydractinia symbiolongicarpus TaxID=13093 RepID=UPI0025504C01|nr:cell cycle checkpoint protein RAD17-like isoform X2 [Hydractinia symbiolongicarpus]